MGILYDIEYMPVIVAPQKIFKIYLSEELLIHQLIEFGIMGSE